MRVRLNLTAAISDTPINFRRYGQERLELAEVSSCVLPSGTVLESMLPFIVVVVVVIVGRAGARSGGRSRWGAMTTGVAPPEGVVRGCNWYIGHPGGPTGAAAAKGPL